MKGSIREKVGLQTLVSMSTSKAQLLLKFAPCAALFGRAFANMLLHEWDVYMWSRVHWGGQGFIGRSVAARGYSLDWRVGNCMDMSARFVGIRLGFTRPPWPSWLDTLGRPFCPFESTWM